MAKWIAFVVPVLYLALILWLEPQDQLGDPPAAPFLGRALYDDYDTTAYVIRALNAERGRKPGLRRDPDIKRPDGFNAELERNAPVDLDSPYFLEYPLAALWMFRFPFRLLPSARELKPPQAVLDASQNDVVEHVPEGEAERHLWGEFRQVIRLYQVAAIGCLLVLVAVLLAGYEPGGGLSGPILLLVLPATLYFTANRFDIVPALLMALSFCCLRRDRLIGSALFLGAATMVKVYPVLAAVLVVRYLSADLRRAAVWSVTYALTLGAFLAPALWQWGWDATLAPYRYQLTRPLEDLLTFYGKVFPYSFGEDTLRGKVFRLGGLLATLALLGWNRPANLTSLLRRVTVFLAVFVSLLVFYSPQWIVWFTPLLVPLAGKDRPILYLTVALDLVMYLTFPLAYDLRSDLHRREWLTVLAYARASVLACVVSWLLWAEFGKMYAGRATAGGTEG